MKKFMIFLIPALLGAAGCSDSSSGGGGSITQIADGVNLIAQSVAVAGSKLGGGAFTSSLSSAPGKFAVTPFTSAQCDAHGSPQTSGGASIPDTDAIYPFLHTYCAMTIADGETVRGGFDLARSLVCSLEKGGIEFAGATQSILADFSDTECWPDGGPGGSTGTLTFSAVGSAPASFNSHFEKGVVFTVASIGLTFSIAANITSTGVEFIAHELWSGAGAGDSAGNTGVMSGEINKTTGVLRFEKRDERVRADCVNSSCGWNRHTRLRAVLTMSGGSPTGLTSLSYGYSNIDVPVTTLSGAANNGSGKVISASGSLSGGIKARIFKTASGRSLAQMKLQAQYIEDTGTGCATSAGFDDGADCTSETGIAGFSSSTKFTLLSTPDQATPAAWLAAFAGFNFSAVDLDVDEAY